MKDRQGTEIEVGCIVAYNLSGAVALGTVERLTVGYQYDNKVLHVMIRPHSAWVSQASKRGVSKVSCLAGQGWGSKTPVEVTDKIIVLTEKEDQ